jgi:hypothetical protein
MYAVVSLSFFYFLSASSTLFAACNPAIEFCNPISYNDMESFLLAIVNAIIYILFPIIVLMIVYTGFLFVKAQGNPAKLSEARTALMWTIIGGLIVLGSYALAIAIKSTIATIMAP